MSKHNLGFDGDKPLNMDHSFRAGKQREKKLQIINGHNDQRVDHGSSIIREMKDGFFVINFEGVICDVNDSFCYLSGYSRDELLNKKINEFANFVSSAQLFQAFLSGVDYYETIIETKDREKISIEISINRLNQNDGKFYCFCRRLSNYGSNLFQRNRTVDRTEILVKTASILAYQFDNKDLLNLFCEEIVSIFNLHAAHISLVDEANANVRVVASHGFYESYNNQKSAFSLDDINQQLLRFGFDKVGVFSISKMIFQNDQKLFDLNFRIRVTAQIIHNHELLGFLNLFSRDEKITFSMEDRTLLYGLANQVSQTIINRKLYEEVISTRERLSTFNQRLIEVQENEKRNLALELHDQLGQMLSSAKIALDITSEVPEKMTVEQIRWASNQIGDIIARVRRLSLDLRPSMLDDFGLLAALHWLCKDYQKQTNEKITFLHKGLNERFSDEIEISVYRIVQEALTNIIRHAGSYKAVIKIWAKNNVLNIRIQDFGSGFHPASALLTGESTGLAGMMERVNLLQGKMRIKSILNQGTCIIIELPINKKGEK